MNTQGINIVLLLSAETLYKSNTIKDTGICNSAHWLQNNTTKDIFKSKDKQHKFSTKYKLIIEVFLISTKSRDRLDFPTEDFGLGKGRKELRLAAHILVELQEVLMKSPKIAIPLPHCYLHRERKGEFCN